MFNGGKHLYNGDNPLKLNTKVMSIATVVALAAGMLNETKVLALSLHADASPVRGLMDAGAGYVLKECAAEELAADSEKSNPSFRVSRIRGPGRAP